MKKFLLDLGWTLFVGIFGVILGSYMTLVNQKFDEVYSSNKFWAICSPENYVDEYYKDTPYYETIYVGPSDAEIAWTTFIEVNEELFYNN